MAREKLSPQKIVSLINGIIRKYDLPLKDITPLFGGKIRIKEWYRKAREFDVLRAYSCGNGVLLALDDPHYGGEIRVVFPFKEELIKKVLMRNCWGRQPIVTRYFSAHVESVTAAILYLLAKCYFEDPSFDAGYIFPIHPGLNPNGIYAYLINKRTKQEFYLLNRKFVKRDEFNLRKISWQVAWAEL